MVFHPKGITWSGGAVYLITFLGIYSIIYPQLSNITEVIGVSSGAIMALITTLRLNPTDLITVIESYQMDQLIRFDCNGLGLSSNQPLFYFIGSILLAAHLLPSVTFAEMYTQTGIDLRIGVTNLTAGRFEIMDHLTRPTMKVHDAILMSCIFPGLFTPIIYDNQVYIDGGVMCNYPIQHSRIQDRRQLMGIILLDRIQPLHGIHTMIDVTTRTLELLLHMYQRLHILPEYKTMTVHTLPHLSILNFHMTDNNKNELYEHGVKYAQQWMATLRIQQFIRKRRRQQL
jgi:predicted acylesterase/phospholipase RssA